ncbi:MAG: zinc-binding dehydrogenase [Planctomycetes bacterium]|nr:zinc-binding dehydrogenase [Planctomycetota bacterium]
MDRFEQYQQKDIDHIPATMKAVVLNGTGFDKVVCREVPVPQPAPDQLLCRVDAAGVCTSIIKLLEQGPAHTFINGWDLEKFPVILGDEGAVTVVKAGDNLKNQYKTGSRFAIQPAVDVSPINHRERYRNNAAGMNKCAVGYTLGGNLAQYILIQEEVLKAKCLLPLPSDNMPYFAVSMAEPISCICSAQDRQIHIRKDGPFGKRVPQLGLLEGGTTVVIGAGAMGLMHAEMATRYRPRNLIVSDILPDRLEKGRRILADKASRLGVNLITVHADELKAALDKASGGAGADDIILAIGVQPVQQEALALLARGGVANLFGGLPRGKHLLQVDAIAVHYNEIKLVGSSGGEPSDLVAALDAIAAGDIDPGNFVYGIGSLEHVPQVLRMIQDRQVDGKVIIYPHAGVEKLTQVSHWSQADEREHLVTRLAKQ